MQYETPTPKTVAVSSSQDNLRATSRQGNVVPSSASEKVVLRSASENAVLVLSPDNAEPPEIVALVSRSFAPRVDEMSGSCSVFRLKNSKLKSLI